MEGRYVRSLYTNIATVGNIGSGVQNLREYLLQPKLFKQDGDAVKVRNTIKLADNANNKLFQVWVGDNSRYYSGVIIGNSTKQVVCETTIIRKGGNVLGFSTFVVSDGTIPPIEGGAEGNFNFDEEISVRLVAEVVGEDIDNNVLSDFIEITFIPAS